MPSNERYSDSYRAVPERHTQAYVIPPLDEDPRYGGHVRGRRRIKDSISVASSAPAQQQVSVSTRQPSRPASHDRAAERQNRAAARHAQPQQVPAQGYLAQQRPTQQRPTQQRPTQQRPTQQRPAHLRPAQPRPSQARPTQAGGQNAQKRKGSGFGQFLWIIILIVIVMLTVGRPLLNDIIDAVSTGMSDDPVYEEPTMEPAPEPFADPEGLLPDFSTEIVERDDGWVMLAISVTNSADESMSYTADVYVVTESGDNDSRYIYHADMEPGETVVEDRSFFIDAIADDEPFEVVIADISRW